MKREERDERLTRRIESFSDLVIGFSLALLALTLSIPPHIVDLLTNPSWLVAYFWTFAVVAGIWYSHQRLFTHFFWPETFSIVLNFTLLSMVGLLVYFVQVFVHYHSTFDRVWAFIAYFAVLGIAFIALGTLYLHGARRRWGSLDAEDRYVGFRQGLRNIVGGAFMLVGALVTALLPVKSMDDLWPLAIFVFAGFFAARIVARLLKARIVAGA
ncbi:MAG: TMEM175 family protein [Candidatus Aquilonibacter sp.]